MAQLDKIKRRVGITDNLQDDLINDLIEGAEACFFAITGNSVPSKFEFMIIEVVVRKYNRKGSEGIKTESIDGYSASYSTDDFSDYWGLLDDEYGLSDRKRGKVRFL